MAEKKETPAPEAKKMDETIPGGRYIINGVEVNSEGEPISEKAK